MGIIVPMSAPILSLVARGVLSLAVEKLAFCPFLTLWMACCHAADDLGTEGQRGLDELAALLGTQEAPGPFDKVCRLRGSDAVEEATRFLQAATYPDTAPTVPAPAPTVETPTPVDEAIMVAAFCLREAWEQMERARELLGAKGDPKLSALQKDLTTFTKELSKTLEEHPLKEVA